MVSLFPWLSANALRQAYLSFDMDTPADMPQRPIVQVIKIGTSTVTMQNKKQPTVKYVPSKNAYTDVDFIVPMAEWDNLVYPCPLFRYSDLYCFRNHVLATRYVAIESYRPRRF